MARADERVQADERDCFLIFSHLDSAEEESWQNRGLSMQAVDVQEAGEMVEMDQTVQADWVQADERDCSLTLDSVEEEPW
jgi:hypothetical protein